MPDTALSVTASSSPLAAVLSGGHADSSAPAKAQSKDPFAALLADATRGEKPATSGKSASSETIAALLASAAPVPTVPVAATPTPATPATAEAVPLDALPAEPLPLDPDAAPHAAKAKTKNADADADADKDDDSDALADAIASGATAVLAFAPAIVAPVQNQTPARIDAPVATPSKPASVGAISGRPGLKPVKTDAAPIQDPPVPALAQVDADAAQTPAFTAPAAPLPPEVAKAVAALKQGDLKPADPTNAPAAIKTDPDADAPKQQAPAPLPAATQLPPEVAKAVMTALKQSDGAPATTTMADPREAQTAALAAKAQAEQKAQQPTVQHGSHPAVPAQAQPRTTAHDSSEEAPAPRRAGDTRKRVDPVLTDAASAAAAPRTADTPRTGFALGGAAAAAKGDALVEQTLTIAKDGAWLDRLAKDIASAGSGNDLHFKLNPQNLGALSVAISQKEEGASIRLTADNQQTRDILVDAQPKLIAEARAQGLKVADTQVDVRQDDKQQQNQGNSQDSQRWAQNQSGQNGQQAQTGHHGQNRQSSPEHKPFVSNLGRKAAEESESPDRDSDALYA